jgi:hypothetical protein
MDGYLLPLPDFAPPEKNTNIFILCLYAKKGIGIFLDSILGPIGPGFQAIFFEAAVGLIAISFCCSETIKIPFRFLNLPDQFGFR